MSPGSDLYHTALSHVTPSPARSPPRRGRPPGYRPDRRKTILTDDPPLGQMLLASMAFMGVEPNRQHAYRQRSLLKALVPFPTADDLVTVIERTTGAITPKPDPVCDAETLRAMIALVRQVPVPDHVVRHAVDLVIATHPDQAAAPAPVGRYVRFGASPRGVQALILTGKARAVRDGRPSVSIDDVRAAALAALRHRLVVGYEATADGTTADEVIGAVLAAVPEPTSGVRGAP